MGEVELVKNRTSWVAEEARKIDYYVITGGDYKTIYSRYADVTGHSPQLPFWATGFWQSKLRYASQEEVLNVVDEYQNGEYPYRQSSLIIYIGHAWGISSGMSVCGLHRKQWSKHCGRRT